jgi:hypothetical protein
MNTLLSELAAISFLDLPSDVEETGVMSVPLGSRGVRIPDQAGGV